MPLAQAWTVSALVVCGTWAAAGSARPYGCYRVERAAATLLASFPAESSTVAPTGAWAVGADLATLTIVDLASGQSRSCTVPGEPSPAMVRFLGWDGEGDGLWLSMGASPARIAWLTPTTGTLDVLWETSFDLFALGEDGRAYFGGSANSGAALLVGDRHSRNLNAARLDGAVQWMAPRETHGRLPFAIEDRAHAGQRVLCIHDVAEARVLSLGLALTEPTPLLSPSGERAAFATSEGIRAGEVSEPRLVRALGNGQRALTLAFASEDRLIATVARDAGDRVRSLEVTDLGAQPAGPRVLVQRPGGGPFWQVAVRPDGEWALVAAEGQAGPEAYTVRLDGRADPVRLPCSQPASDPLWSPDGARLAFVSGVAPGESVPYLYEGPDGSGPGILPDARSAGLIGFSRDSGRLLLSVQAGSSQVVEYVWSRRRGFPLTLPPAAQPEDILWTEDPAGRWIAIVPGA